LLIIMRGPPPFTAPVAVEWSSPFSIFKELKSD
jgi:hypothetical protein